MYISRMYLQSRIHGVKDENGCMVKASEDMHLSVCL